MAPTQPYRSQSKGELRPLTGTAFAMRASERQRRGMSKAAIQKMNDEKKADKDMRHAAKDKKSLKRELIKKYGTITAAWRYGLDVAALGKLGFNDFCKACRGLSYDGDIKLCFKDMDADESGVISFEELDDYWYIRLSLFQERLLTKYGNYEDAWRAIDSNGNNQIDRQEFIEICDDIGFPGEIEGHQSAELEALQLFRQLLPDLGQTIISFKDLNVDKVVGRTIASSKTTPSKSQSAGDLRHKSKSKDDPKDCGASTIDDIKRVLCVRFGNLFSGWRQALDLDGNDRLSFGEFCIAMRNLGFNGNVKAAWSSLDSDKDGFIQLSDLDPALEQMITSYKVLVKQTFGCTLAAWIQALGKDGSGSVDVVQFTRHCKDIGWKGDCTLLFECLKNDKTRKQMCLRDYDIPAYFAWQRGDLEMLADGERQDGTKMTFYERQANTFRNRWERAQSKIRIKQREDAEKLNRAADVGAKGLDELKKLLVGRFGNFFAGWRQALDLDGNGRLSFCEFCHALRDLGFAGSVKGFWQELDSDGDGFIELSDLDQDLATMLSTYKEAVIKVYGNTLKAWMASLGRDGNGVVDKPHFANHCKRIGWAGDVDLLFESLKNDKTRKCMSLRDYDVAAYSAFQHGDLGMISAGPASPTSPLEMNFLERQSMCFRQRWAKHATAEQLEAQKARHDAEKEADKGAGDLASMKHAMIAKYGTVTAAWRHGFEGNENGRVAFTEFCQAMRGLGFVGNIQQCFLELDSDGKGHITLKDLDAPAHELLSSFRKLLLDKFGTYIKAWIALDEDRSGSLEKPEVVKACRKIGFEGDAKLLFKLMLDGPGKKVITMADLDPAAMRAYYRGDLEAMSEHQKAKTAIKAMADAKKAEKDKFMAANDYKSFKKELIRKHGTVVAAWRYGLDTAGMGKIGFYEFSKACRDIGFIGDIRLCFRELDDDESGVISFEEVSSVWFVRLSKFQELMLAKYNTYANAWSVIDANKNNQIDREEFVGICKDIGYPGGPEAARALFRQLLPHLGATMIAPEDLNIDKVVNREIVWTGAPSAYELAKAELQRREELARAEKNKQMGANDASSLKREMIKKYGTITAAWRYNFDRMANGKIPFMEFSKACRSIGFLGTIRQCFMELDEDRSGVLSFLELDPTWYTRLAKFQQLILEMYKTYEIAWCALDTGKKNQIHREEFVAFAAHIGYSSNPQEAMQLFRQLLPNPSAKTLFYDDINVSAVVGKPATSPRPPASLQSSPKASKTILANSASSAETEASPTFDASVQKAASEVL
eukprot:TRINITY_DN7460_c0_g1_i1.p1 TRINITY_DN7460_c0_g1~~TRINITY_DN7460_c0_g1_i1.p1  ORF type:complete len:1278 (-),score=287.92 TRINITY_DN7460_c0_g1_i1:32-3865(-)